MNKFIICLVVLLSIIAHAQVGINTNNPHSSAILEVSADAPPGSSETTKKGLLIPRIALTSSIDLTTIPNPANGLIVYNTVEVGTYPNNVSANEYYYWDGMRWEKLVFTSVIKEAVKPRIFYIENTDTQSILPADINYPTAGNFQYVRVDFSGVPVINVNNFITQNADSSFTVNETGLYDFSAFINFNPMKTSGSSFVNLVIQISTNGGASWTNSSALTRTAWGSTNSSYLKTATIQSFPLALSKDSRFRLMLFSPFENGNFGSTGTNPYIGTTDNLPIAKGISVQLLDFNL